MRPIFLLLLLLLAFGLVFAFDVLLPAAQNTPIGVVMGAAAYPSPTYPAPILEIFKLHLPNIFADYSPRVSPYPEPLKP